MALLIIGLGRQIYKSMNDKDPSNSTSMPTNQQQILPQNTPPSYNNRSVTSIADSQKSAPIDEPPPPYQQYAPVEPSRQQQQQQQPRALSDPRYQPQRIAAPQNQQYQSQNYVPAERGYQRQDPCSPEYQQIVRENYGLSYGGYEADYGRRGRRGRRARREGRRHQGPISMLMEEVRR